MINLENLILAKKSTVLQKHSWKKETWKQSGQSQKRTDWMEIAMAAMEYMIIHPKRTWEKRERGAYAEKERSKAIGETKIAIARGKHPEVKGEYGTVIGLIVEDEKGKPVAAGVRNVDGIQAKAHQIYSMTEEREWVEVQK